MNPVDLNCMSFWFPKIRAADLPVPVTVLAEAEVDMWGLLDGEKPAGFDALIKEIDAAADRIAPGMPFFLRTGHTSGKHSWAWTCFVPHPHTPGVIGRHVTALVEESALADIVGLPTRVWAVRELLKTRLLFTCEAWFGCPINREFRFFVRDGTVEEAFPYWPAEAVEGSNPSVEDWRERLERAALIEAHEHELLTRLAVRACEAVGGGYWSVDFLQGADGRWWLTDMAEGDRSYKPGTDG